MGFKDSANICYTYEISDESRWMLYVKILASAFSGPDSYDDFVYTVDKWTRECEEDVVSTEFCADWMHNAIATLCQSVNHCRADPSEHLRYCDGRSLELKMERATTAIIANTTTTTEITTTTTETPFVTDMLLAAASGGFLAAVVLMILFRLMCK